MCSFLHIVMHTNVLSLKKKLNVSQSGLTAAVTSGATDSIHMKNYTNLKLQIRFSNNCKTLRSK